MLKLDSSPPQQSFGPGRRERELLGAFVERMSEFGLTVPVGEGGFCTVEPEWIANHGLRRITGDRTLREGDLVTLNGGVLYSGYEGRVGRTVACGAQARRSGETIQTLTSRVGRFVGPSLQRAPSRGDGG